MGKRTHARTRSHGRGRQSAHQGSHGNPLELFDELLEDVDADVRLLRADDTAAEPLRSLLDAENTQLPVALIEPVRNSVVRQGGGTYEVRIAIATRMGLPVVGPLGLLLAPGWTFGPCQGKWELVDPTATLIARCMVATEDSAREAAWTAQAVAAGQVLVVYGPRVGVQVPEGVHASHYDDQNRAAELYKSLVGRRACAAMVTLSQQMGAFRRSRSN